MDDEINRAQRSGPPDAPPSGRESHAEAGGRQHPGRRTWEFDAIHRQGWLAYVLGVLLLLGLLFVVGRAVAGWMAHYAETAMAQPEEP